MADKITCSLEGGDSLFLRYVDLEAQGEWTGLLKGKVNLLLKKLQAWARLPAVTTQLGT